MLKGVPKELRNLIELQKNCDFIKISDALFFLQKNVKIIINKDN